MEGSFLFPYQLPKHFYSWSTAFSISKRSIFAVKYQVMNRAGEIISHSGIIERIDKQSVYVKILSSSACSSCTVKGACNLAESKEKLVEVKKQQDEVYSVGRSVDVVMQRSSGTRAVLLAYLVPFGIVLLSLIVLLSAGTPEGISALLSMALLVPYYLVLHHFKDKLKKEFEFTIQSK